jgi:Na+/proline symporter
MNGGRPVAVSQNPVDSVGPYLVAIVLLTILTGIYTTKGGIKAVIWTDVIQACLMFGTALLAVWSLLGRVGGWEGLASAVPQMGHLSGYFATGFDSQSLMKWQLENHVIPPGDYFGPPRMSAVNYLHMIVSSDYTLVSAIVAATAMNIAAFGTDQDMVQRLLTAKDARRARRSLLTAAFMDIPIASVFTFIGILLFAFYKAEPMYMPKSQADVFGSYILNVMPAGLRGLVLAGVFATAMGSLSAALNALATSATNDFYIPFTVRPRKGDEPRVEQAQILRAARFFTVLFAMLMVAVAGAFAYVKVHNPTLGIIPVVLGIAGYVLGPMLGVFLLGIFTKRRGSDGGNVVALIAGLLATTLLGDLPCKIDTNWPFSPPWNVSFTWYAFIGAAAVVAVGIWFRTPEAVLEAAVRRAEQAEEPGADVPLALRG